MSSLHRRNVCLKTYRRKASRKAHRGGRKTRGRGRGRRGGYNHVTVPCPAGLMEGGICQINACNGTSIHFVFIFFIKCKYKYNTINNGE